MTPRVPPTSIDLMRWAEALSGIARTGLGFTQSLYERERFEEILHIAGEIRAAALEGGDITLMIEEWLASVGEGILGYVTPKTAVGAVVANADGEILLVKRSGTGVWLYPTGWADVGYSPSEVAAKEVLEETGIECAPRSLIAVFDGMRLGVTHVPLYSLIFHCEMLGGTLQGHPLETLDVGFFARDALPEPLAGGGRWVDLAFDAIEGRVQGCFFDEPRKPTWRVPPDHDA
jgi:ADP-ribose pyrophosphatase YjhB (NUDIX family)